MLPKLLGRSKSPAQPEQLTGELASSESGESDAAFEDAAEAQLHPDAHEEGGLACTNLALLEEQRGAVVEVIKSLGKNLIMGNLDLLRVSLPVKMFEPRSYLQKLADPWVYPRFLQLAAETADPVERLQWAVTYFVAGFHRAFAKWAKPFNPILGETWQASLPDGSAIFLEQLSHHPPISAFQLLGPRGLYAFSGQSQPSITYKGNSVKTTARGYRVLDFADGGRIELHFPAYYLRGLLYTAAPRGELAGTAEFVDARNGLEAVVRFGQPVEGARGSSVLQRPDAFSGSIYRTPPVRRSGSGSGGTTSLSATSGSQASAAAAAGGMQRQPSAESGGGGGGAWRMPTSADKHRRNTGPGITNSFSSLMRSGLGLRSKSSPAVAEEGAARVVVARCTGNWLSHIDWDGQRFWTLAEEAGEEWAPVEAPLPSDCRFREDLKTLAAGDVKGAQAAKEALEQRQRADAKLRKAGGGA